jgi:hypothetical protein
MMLRERPNYLCLGMHAHDNLIWTCHKYAYFENRVQPNVGACLVMRELNYHLRAEADCLLSSKERRSLKCKLRHASAKPMYSPP